MEPARRDTIRGSRGPAYLTKGGPPCPFSPSPISPLPTRSGPRSRYCAAHKQARLIPARAADRLLVATWNIANFGAQERRDQDRALIAEIVSWFDLVAIQECRENFGDLFDLHQKLPISYRVIMSDASGNNERMAFLYDSAKLILLEEIGEIAFPPSRLKIDQASQQSADLQGL